MSEVATIERADVSAPVQGGESAALISMIERAARDPNVDIDKMERLFQMHERIDRQRRETAYNSAMASAQAELVPVARKLNNSQTKSKYADLAALSEAAMPVIYRHGFGISHSEFKSDRAGHLGVRAEVTHASGFSKLYDFHIPMDGTGLKGNANMTATHAYGSTFSYGRRYSTCGVFNIATKDDDGNAAGAKPSAESATVEQITQLIKDSGSSLTWFLETYSVETLEDLTGKQRDEIRSKLTAKIAAARRANANG